MSPLQASIVNTCLIDSDRDRKGVLNSCQCFDASGTAVDLQGRSGQPSRMERCFGLFGLGGFELKGKYNTKSKRRALSHTLRELKPTGTKPVAFRFSNSQLKHNRVLKLIYCVFNLSFFFFIY